MKERYVVILLLFLLALYNAQEILYTKGSVISQLALVVIHGVGCIYLIKTLFLPIKKTLFFKAWTALLTLNVFGLIFTGNINNPLHFGMFKGILMNLLVFYPFYYLGLKKILNKKDLIVFLLVLIPISIAQFYLTHEQIISQRVTDNTNVVNNTAYDLLWLLPFVFFIKKNKIISVSLFLIILFFIIQSAKRGAMIIATITLLFYIYYQLKTVSSKHRVWSYLLTFIGVILIGYYTYNFFIQNEYLIERLQQFEDGGFSGRDIIYANLFNAWYHSESYLNILFGFGFASSVNLSGTGNLAHNDWLELLSNFGLLGVSIYLIIFYSGFKTILSKKWNIDERIILSVIFIMWILSTLFSMGYTTNGGFIKAILLAYLLGKANKEHNIL